MCKALGSDPPATTTATEIGPHTKKSPIEDSVPRAGERVGFMVSTFARANRRTANRRSDIVFVDWPS